MTFAMIIAEEPNPLSTPDAVSLKKDAVAANVMLQFQKAVTVLGASTGLQIISHKVVEFHKTRNTTLHYFVISYT